MAEQKIKVTDGQRTWVTTAAEMAEMNRNRPSYLAPIVPVREDTKVRATFENQDGEFVDQLLPASAVNRRARNLGQNVVATPEGIELARQASQERILSQIADEANVTAFANEALPGAQFIQNALVGEEEAIEARRSLYGNNPFVGSFLGNIAEYAIGARGIGMGIRGALGAERAAAVGASFFGKNANAARAAGAMLGEELAISTHFYVQNALNEGDPFSAEEWAREVGMGLTFGAPFIAGAAGRGAARSILRAGAREGALETGRTLLTLGAVMAPPGSMQAAMRARGAAAMGIGGKLFRKFRKKPLGATTEMTERAARLYDDLDVLGKTVDDLDGMRKNTHRRTEYLKRLEEIHPEGANFDDIAWGTLGPRVRTMKTSVQAVRSSVRKLFTKLDGGGGPEITMSEVGRNRVLTQVNEALKFMDDVGMSEVKGTVTRKIIAQNATPNAIRKALIEAAFQAKLRRGVSGGAAEVDDLLSGLLRDEAVWGRQAAKNARIVEALDEVRQTWDTLGEAETVRGLSEVEFADGVRLQGKQAEVRRMRDAIKVLADAGMLSEQQVKQFDSLFIQADDAIASGTSAVADAIRFNKARTEATAQVAKELEIMGEVPKNAEDFAAAKVSAAVEAGHDVIELGGSALSALLSTRILSYKARGVIGITALPVNEKYTLYETLEENINNYVANPDALVSSMGSMLDSGATWDPSGADMAALGVSNTMQYLASQLPRRDNTMYGRNAPAPLSAVEEFLEKYVAAYDPVSVAYAALMGRATPGMIDSVRITQPHTYAELRMVLAKALEKTPAEKANPSVVSGISMFLGGMDTMYTGEFISSVQSTYAQTQDQDRVINGPRPQLPLTQAPPPRGTLTTGQRQQTY